MPKMKGCLRRVPSMRLAALALCAAAGATASAVPATTPGIVAAPVESLPVEPAANGRVGIVLQAAWTAGADQRVVAHSVEPPDADDPAVVAYRARLQREIAGVKAEYDRRLARDGKASADAWLAEKGREMGRREGEAVRRAQGR